MNALLIAALITLPPLAVGLPLGLFAIRTAFNPRRGGAR